MWYKNKEIMQREILFRGKTINGEWVYGNYAHIKKDFSTVKKGHYISNSVGSPFSFLVRPETVSQYTGLTDINGVKIFEGDFLATGHLGFKCDVTFKDGCFQLILKNSQGNSPLTQVRASRLEIIGNIHDA